MGRPSDAKEQLIAAAKELVYVSSYEAVSVDELCTAAGVGKSSFYHFFSSKQELLLAVLDSRWQQFEALVLKPIASDELPPHKRLVRFFDLLWQGQQARMETQGHVCGCPFGNLTLEMSTQDEAIRARLDWIFQQWLSYFEQIVREAKVQGIVPETLDVALTAQALLAYFEGAMLLAKGRNDPALIRRLRDGVLLIIQYQEVRPAS